jgi:pSer/pThr/pTyr-binding forkhead associated (FHA) protein
MSISQALAELLGVPQSEQPTTYYHLLGISPEEISPAMVERAAYEQSRRLETACEGPYGEFSENLNALIAEARYCLIDPGWRHVYDDQLISATTRIDQGVQRLFVSEERSSGVIPCKQNPSEQRTWTLGAARDCDIVIDDPYVSRRHCRIVYEEGRYWVEDLGSANGTFHNSEPVVRRKEISLDDAIGLGKTLRIKWSQYIGHHQAGNDVEPRPVVVHVARRTLKFSDGTLLIPPSELPAGPDPATASH